MSYRWKPKNVEIDPENPRAIGQCDRCGLLHNVHKLQWQMAFRGSPVPVNTGLLVCDRCLDPLDHQSLPHILPPDPEPLRNVRPGDAENGQVSWLYTVEGDVLSTEDDESFITSIPNPDSSDSAPQQAAVEITTEDGSIIVTEDGDGNPVGYEPNP